MSRSLRLVLLVAASLVWLFCAFTIAAMWSETASIDPTMAWCFVGSTVIAGLVARGRRALLPRKRILWIAGAAMVLAAGVGTALWPRKWEVVREDGSLQCTVTQGWSSAAVRSACGDPAKIGGQPKVMKGWTTFCEKMGTRLNTLSAYRRVQRQMLRSTSTITRWNNWTLLQPVQFEWENEPSRATGQPGRRGLTISSRDGCGCRGRRIIEAVGLLDAQSAPRASAVLSACGETRSSPKLT